MRQKIVINVFVVLFLMADLSRGEDEMRTMERFVILRESLEKTIEKIRPQSLLPPLTAKVEQPTENKNSTLSTENAYLPMQENLEEVEVSEKDVVNHELSIVLEKQRKFLRDIGTKPRDEWSMEELSVFERHKELENELREELNGLL